MSRISRSGQAVDFLGGGMGVFQSFLSEFPPNDSRDSSLCEKYLGNTFWRVKIYDDIHPKKQTWNPTIGGLYIDVSPFSRDIFRFHARF